MTFFQQYLEGCKIYLDGFPQPEQDQLKKIINNGGGTRLDTLTNRVTHVIAKSRTLKEVNSIKIVWVKGYRGERPTVRFICGIFRTKGTRYSS